jgi:hypothetical protein
MGARVGAKRGLRVPLMHPVQRPRSTDAQIVAVSDITCQAHNPSGRGFEPHPPHTFPLVRRFRARN